VTVLILLKGVLFARTYCGCRVVLVAGPQQPLSYQQKYKYLKKDEKGRKEKIKGKNREKTRRAGVTPGPHVLPRW
jgi:hypothetical protein